MMKMLGIAVLVSFSVSAHAADKAGGKTATPATATAEKSAPAADAKKGFSRKVASVEIKCSENPNEGIGIDPEYVEKQVNAAGSCYEASHIVESCGAGSSMDNMMTAPAIALCDKATGRLSKADADLKKRMNARCGTSCNPQTDGTLCISSQAFCRLDVSKFINGVTSANH